MVISKMAHGQFADSGVVGARAGVEASAPWVQVQAPERVRPPQAMGVVPQAVGAAPQAVGVCWASASPLARRPARLPACLPALLPACPRTCSRTCPRARLQVANAAADAVCGKGEETRAEVGAWTAELLLSYLMYALPSKEAGSPAEKEKEEEEEEDPSTVAAAAAEVPLGAEAQPIPEDDIKVLALGGVEAELEHLPQLLSWVREREAQGRLEFSIKAEGSRPFAGWVGGGWGGVGEVGGAMGTHGAPPTQPPLCRVGRWVGGPCAQGSACVSSAPMCGRVWCCRPGPAWCQRQLPRPPATAGPPV